MRTAVDSLIVNSPADKPLLLHILVKEQNAAAKQLRQQVQDYIDNVVDPLARSRFMPVIVESYEFIRKNLNWHNESDQQKYRILHHVSCRHIHICEGSLEQTFMLFKSTTVTT